MQKLDFSPRAARPVPAFPAFAAFAAFAVFGAFAVLVPFAARAQDVPLEKQKGVRGRVVVAPELLSTPVPIEGERERLLRGTALVRRPMGRKPLPLVENPGDLVVMLEGEGLPKPEGATLPKLVFSSMRFTPGSIVTARPTRVQIENKQGTPITVESATAAGAAKSSGPIAPGATGEIDLAAGDHLVTVKELPFASASVRVLDKGRPLPLTAEGEIPLVDIPGGGYQLTFFLGAEPLRIQPINVPDRELVFIDATVSALKVVEVSIKDASMRIAVPPTLKEQPPEVP